MELPENGKPIILDELVNELNAEVTTLYDINEVEVDLTVSSFQNFLTSAKEQIKNFEIEIQNGLHYLAPSRFNRL